jgi:hypothetical protein
VVDELNQWGLDGVKVTLDGPPENHNHFRPSKNGAPSFAAIVNNLAKVCTKTKIRLGGNYTCDNFRSFPPVLDTLAAQGITPDRLERVNFNIVMRIQDTIANNAYHGGCGTIKRAMAARGGPLCAGGGVKAGLSSWRTGTGTLRGRSGRCLQRKLRWQPLQVRDLGRPRTI